MPGLPPEADNTKTYWQAHKAVYDQRVAPQAMAAILTGLLHVPAPRQAEYPVPVGFFRE